MKLTHNEPGLGLRVATHVAYANPSVPQPYALLATDAAHREFIAQDQLYIARDAMPPHDLDLLTKGAERLKTRAVRKRVPGYKSSASVGFPDIMALAPEIAALYKSPSLVAALSQLAGARLEPCPDRESSRLRSLLLHGGWRSDRLALRLVSLPRHEIHGADWPREPNGREPPAL